MPRLVSQGLQPVVGNHLVHDFMCSDHCNILTFPEYMYIVCVYIYIYTHAYVYVNVYVYLYVHVYVCVFVFV